MPKVDDRTEGELVLTLAVKGKEVFRDVKDVSVLNTDAREARGLAGLDGQGPAGLRPARHGRAVPQAQNGIPFTPLTTSKSLPDAGKVLVVGKDALDAAESDFEPAAGLRRRRAAA